MISDLFRSLNSENDIEVRWGDFLLSFLVFSIIFEQNWHSIAREVIPAELPQRIDQRKNFSFLIIKSYLTINWTIIGVFRVSTKNSEEAVFDFECFFGLKAVLVELYFEVVKEQDVTDSEIEREVLSATAVEVDIEGLSSWGIDDFEFLGEVSVVFIAVDVGGIGDDADRAEQLFLDVFALFCFFAELSNAE